MTQNIKRLNKDILIDWFLEHYPDEYYKMVSTNHSLNDLNISELNPYHIEGSVWTHTLMVMTYIEAKEYNDFTNNILLIVALLHDIGKPYAIDIKEGCSEINKPARYSFNGHEGISFFLSLNIIVDILKYFPYIHTSKVIILKLISLHGVDDQEQDEQELRQLFRQADKNGACRKIYPINNDIQLQDRYNSRNFVKISNNQIIKKDTELLMIMGLDCVQKAKYVMEFVSGENNKEYFIFSKNNYMKQYAIIKGLPINSLDDYEKIYNFCQSPIHKKSFDIQYQQYILNVSNTYSKVIVDMEMLSLSDRRKILNNFKHFEYKNCIVYLPKINYINDLMYNNSNKSNKLSSFIFPVYDEGFDNILIKY